MNILPKGNRYPPGTFFTGPLGVLTNKKLTPKSKLVLFYLLSKPQNWVNQIPDIASQMNIGKETVQSAFRELKKQGYARMVAGRNRKGELTGMTWEVAYESGHFTINGKNPSTVKTIRGEIPPLPK